MIVRIWYRSQNPMVLSYTPTIKENKLTIKIMQTSKLQLLLNNDWSWGCTNREPYLDGHQSGHPRGQILRYHCHLIEWLSWGERGDPCGTSPLGGIHPAKQEGVSVLLVFYQNIPGRFHFLLIYAYQFFFDGGIINIHH